MDLTDDQLERYARHIVLKEVGGPGQARLLGARVLVVGAGGLGSPLLMYLAAAGVGTLGIVDDDRVSLSNLQRQIVHHTADVGRPKGASAAERLAAINPDVTVTRHDLRLTADNADTLVADYDVIADGSDNFTTRLAVNDACVRQRRTLVSAALSQFEAQLATFKPHAGKPGRPLPCYRCFLPAAPDAADRSCADAGLLGAMAGVLGAWQAVEVIKELLGIGDSLAGRMVIFDALTARTRTIRLPADPACPTCANTTATRTAGLDIETA